MIEGLKSPQNEHVMQPPNAEWVPVSQAPIGVPLLTYDPINLSGEMGTLLIVAETERAKTVALRPHLLVTPAPKPPLPMSPFDHWWASAAENELQVHTKHGPQSSKRFYRWWSNFSFTAGWNARSERANRNNQTNHDTRQA